MNLKLRDFFALVVFSIIVGFIILYLIQVINNKERPKMIGKYQNRNEIKEQVQYLKDSVDDEFYKKELETYPFEHSKITEDGK